MEPDKEFEDWYMVRGWSGECRWHPERGDYTVFSTKQYAWEVWKASRQSTIERCLAECEKIHARGFRETAFECIEAIRTLK